MGFVDPTDESHFSSRKRRSTAFLLKPYPFKGLIKRSRVDGFEKEDVSKVSKLHLRDTREDFSIRVHTSESSTAPNIPSVSSQATKHTELQSAQPILRKKSCFQ